MAYNALVEMEKIKKIHKIERKKKRYKIQIQNSQ